MKKFKYKYRIESARMPGWDYSKGGKYYITICTRNRICCFGDVINKKMELNDMGKIANDFWLEIPKHFHNTWLDEFVVMPNHIHGIVVMKRSQTSPEPQTSPKSSPMPINPTKKRTIPNWKPGSLGVIINQFKRICTIEIKKQFHDFAWQHRFHDEIIRNDADLQRIRQYIKNNPKNWNDD